MKWTEPAPLRFTAILPDMHPVVARALQQRGLATRQAVNAFIDPQAYLPTSASQLPGLVQAVARLEFAIRRRQSICVWGDFDVDGQTSTTILYQTLHDLGAQVTFHIPVRDRESHGVNLPILQEVINQGAQLILTCDTGITSNPAVDYAHSRGVDMIVTDHHDLPPLLPSAFAIVNPKLLLEGHPLATLSGAGVAYKLSEELCARIGCPELSIHHLDLTALGLVGDLAALTGDTRYLVQLGLAELRHTRRLGLQVMLEMAELNPANLTEEHIGFV
jgi:single-stranded-DNA-specific exonuclease